MAILIDPQDRRPIYLQIMDEVRRARLLGSLSPGEPLPSVRQLAAELRINPNTVAQAYRELEREGVVQVQRGLGTFLTAVDPSGADRELARLAATVARRAVLDATRNGLTVGALIDAIRAVEAPAPLPEDDL